MTQERLLALVVNLLALITWVGSATGAEIVGTIKASRTKQVIAGAVVRAIPQSRNIREVQAQTNSQGQYHLELIRGKYRLFISAPNSNYLPQFYSESGQEQGDIIDVPTFQAFIIINCSLASGGSISGQVSRASDLGPIGNVRVSAESKDWRVSVNTDEAGKYQFQALPPGDYKVRVLALDENYISIYFDSALTSDSADSIHLEPEKEANGINFRLRTGGKISGRVFAQKNRQPIAGIKIIAERQIPEENPLFAYTDAQGFYELRGLTDGTYTVESGATRSPEEPSPSRARYLTQYYEGRFDKVLATKLRIEGGNSITGVNFALVQSGRISGSVRSLAYGTPLSDVAIFPKQVQKEILSPPAPKSDEQGYYLIENLPPGEYILDSVLPKRSRRYVGVYYLDKLGPESADKVFVEENGLAKNIDFNLILGATLKGHLKIDDPEYKFDAVASAVSLKRAPPDLEGFGERTYQLAQDGSFTIEGTPPGKYSLMAKVPDPNLRLQNSPEGKSLDLWEGEVREGLDFSIKVGGSISGTVSTKSPFYTLDKLLLVLVSIKENTKSYFSLNSDHYSLTGLDPGKYVLILLSNPDKTHPDSTFQSTRVFDTRVVEVAKGKATTGVDFQLTTSEN
ncbi:MAG TPA: carboxypeptidase regulatory-like domain-containing protein [Terriglobia bacterium]|nr:carboxypeptidase regulatory-like domain-containing protein [Terriglobia bacterium]